MFGLRLMTLEELLTTAARAEEAGAVGTFEACLAEMDRRLAQEVAEFFETLPVAEAPGLGIFAAMQMIAALDDEAEAEEVVVEFVPAWGSGPTIN